MLKAAITSSSSKTKSLLFASQIHPYKGARTFRVWVAAATGPCDSPRTQRHRPSCRSRWRAGGTSCTSSCAGRGCCGSSCSGGRTRTGRASAVWREGSKSQVSVASAQQRREELTEGEQEVALNARVATLGHFLLGLFLTVKRLVVGVSALEAHLLYSCG